MTKEESRKRNRRAITMIITLMDEDEEVKMINSLHKSRGKV